MQETKIEWAEHTHNFWTGCRKVSDGCKFCYMHRLYEGKRDAKTVIRNDKGFYHPGKIYDPKLIFTCSMSDFFIPEADKWRNEAWKVIRQTPWHTYQILTKRPERILKCLPKDWGDGYKNVWLGVSIENQKNFHRASTLANIPAALRFISAEPLIDELDLLATDNEGRQPIELFDWVIIGGESGYNKGKFKFRPCYFRWIDKVVRDLKENTTARVFVKQLGTFLAQRHKLKSWYGGDITEFPDYLKFREMPDRPQTKLTLF